MQINRMLRSTLIGGIFLVPFIPLIVMGEWYFPFITGKNYAFRILVEVLFAVWIILAIRDIRFRPSFSWLIVAVGIFVVIIGAADLFGESPFKSFWSNFERMEGFLALIHLALYFLILGTVLQTERLWGWLAHTSVGVSVLLGAYGILQMTGLAPTTDTSRITATLGNATYMAVYMLFHIFITALLLYRWRGGLPAGGWVRFLYGIIIMLQGAVLYYTATRGAILGLLGGVLLSSVLVIIFNWRRRGVRRAAGGVLAVLLIVVGGFFALKDTAFVKESAVLNRFATISFDEGTVKSRFTIWGMAWEGFMERPVLGWGQENFNFVFNTHYQAKLYDQEAWFDRAHNIVFDWLAAGGALGLLAYLAIALLALYYLWKPFSPFSYFESSVLTGLLAAYGFHNLFVFDNIVSYILYFSVLAYIYARTRPPVRPGTLSGAHVNAGAATRIAVPLVLIALVGSLYFFNLRGMVVADTLIDALRSQQTQEYDQSLAQFRTAAAYRTTGRQEVREQLVQAAMRIAGRPGVPIETKQAYFDAARAEMAELVEAAPNDARTRMFYGLLFSAYGQGARAIEQLERARELSLQKQQILFILGRIYINQGETGMARDVLRKAFELAPENDEAAIQYAIGLILTGQSDSAERLLTEHFGTALIDDGDLIRAYTLAGRHDRVLAIFRQRIADDPENLQAYLSLAGAYLEAGQRDRAIEQVRAAMERFPDFRAQGEQFIRQIQRGQGI